MIHNHGPHEGPGLDCPEVRDAYDRKKGMCLPVTLVLLPRPARAIRSRDEYAGRLEPWADFRAVAARRLDTSAPFEGFELWRHRGGEEPPHWSYGPSSGMSSREAGAGARAWLRGLRG